MRTRSTLNYSLTALFGIAVMLLASCKEGPLHEDVVIGGNTPPPYDGVPSVIVNNYINNLYIDLLGRGPTQSELAEAQLRLYDGELEDPARVELIELLQSSYDFGKNFDVLTKAKFINGVDSLEIVDEIYIYDVTIGNLLTLGDTLNAFFFERIRDDLDKIRVSGWQLWNGECSIEEFYRRHIMNPFYDEVNMGSENYVLSVFENLYAREPTSEELEQGILMVDGVGGFLFLQDGNSKREFADIAVNSASFWEGLVVNLYLSLLARQPDSQELVDLTTQLLDGVDFRVIQQEIMKSEEYAGF